MSASNYPPGVSDHTVGAPWNEPEIPDKDFNITCTQTLSKTVTITTNNYIPGASGVDWETDDEGHPYATPWHEPDDTSDTDWFEEYHSHDYYNPLQLIQLLGEVLKENLEHGIVFRTPMFTQNLIAECEGWQEDETEYIEG